jgi:hypothetical protein
MPVLAALAVVLGGYWAWRRGWLQRWTWQDGIAAALVLLGLRMVASGRLLIAAVLLAAGMGWAMLRLRRPQSAPATRQPEIPPPTASPMSVAEARAVLELSDHADIAAIQQAHRRLIAVLHPDKGGSASLAAQVNQARDVLLAQANADNDTKNSSDIR